MTERKPARKIHERRNARGETIRVFEFERRSGTMYRVNKNGIVQRTGIRNELDALVYAESL